MKWHYFLALFLCGCSGLKATYLEPISAGTVIDRSLYSVSVPQDSTDSYWSDAKWERYSEDGKANNLILRKPVGSVSSYAVHIEVTESLTNVSTIDDLTKRVASDREYMEFALSTHMQEFPQTQRFLRCIKPAIRIDAAPERPHGFFWHKLACTDTKTHHYYELNISYMTTRKGDTPPEALERLAEHFFKSFTVKD